MVEPGFFVLEGHNTLLVAVDLVLLGIVGFRHNEALKQAIRDYPMCYDEMLESGCYRYYMGIYIAVWVAFLVMLAMNVWQFWVARSTHKKHHMQLSQAARRRMKQLTTVWDCLRHEDNIPLGISSRFKFVAPGLVAVGTAMAVVQMVWVFTDRHAFLPLIKRMSWSWGLGSTVS